MERVRCPVRPCELGVHLTASLEDSLTPGLIEAAATWQDSGGKGD